MNILKGGFLMQATNHDASATMDATQLCSKQVVGMAYVPSQEWKQPYPLTKGFQNGTIFPSLDKPFDPDERRCQR